jgi:hypothetical protein
VAGVQGLGGQGLLSALHSCQTRVCARLCVWKTSEREAHLKMMYSAGWQWGAKCRKAKRIVYPSTVCCRPHRCRTLAWPA